MSKRVLAALLIVLVAAVSIYALTRRNPRPEAPSETEEAQEPQAPVNLDPKESAARWPPRYRNNPTLFVTEAYALDTIGELPPRMATLVPELVHRSFGKQGDWKALVREELGWPADIDQKIKDGWARFQSAAQKAGTPSNSLDFARQFADEVDRQGNADAGR